jgi:hypothetical protein
MGMQMSENKVNKIKLRFVQYSNLLLLCAGIYLASKEFNLPSCALIGIWYFAFGFLGISRMFAQLKMTKLSKIFLSLTCPFCLVPSFQAWYYLCKAWYISYKTVYHLDEDIFFNKTRKYIQKVCFDNLITNEEKSEYYIVLSYVNYPSKDAYEECLYLAECMVNEDVKKKLLDEIKNARIFIDKLHDWLISFIIYLSENEDKYNNLSEAEKNYYSWVLQNNS